MAEVARYYVEDDAAEVEASIDEMLRQLHDMCYRRNAASSFSLNKLYDLLPLKDAED